MTNIDSREQARSFAHLFLQRAFGSRYLFYALIFHMGVLLLLGTLVVVKPMITATKIFDPIPDVYLHPYQPVQPPQSAIPLSKDPSPQHPSAPTPAPGTPKQDSDPTELAWIHTDRQTPNPFP